MGGRNGGEQQGQDDDRDEGDDAGQARQQAACRDGADTSVPCFQSSHAQLPALVER